MNSCILMAEIVQEPQLRYTPDQTALAEMLVQFPGLRAEDPPATLKVVGWGNLAQEIQQQYHQGDRIIIEGRLSMNTVERPEGFKEKRAELTVQRIHPLGDGVSIGSSAFAPVTERNATAAGSMQSRTPVAASRNTTTEVSVDSSTSEKAEATASGVEVLAESDDVAEPVAQPRTRQVPNYPVPTTEADVDDIPF
jgi:single-stranded DNA-binding protein